MLFIKILKASKSYLPRSYSRFRCSENGKHKRVITYFNMDYARWLYFLHVVSEKIIKLYSFKLPFSPSHGQFPFLSPNTPYGCVRLARFARIRLLRHALPISLLILRKSRARSWWKRLSLSLAFWNQGLTVSQSLEFTILCSPFL